MRIYANISTSQITENTEYVSTCQVKEYITNNMDKTENISKEDITFKIFQHYNKFYIYYCNRKYHSYPTTSIEMKVINTIIKLLEYLK